MKGVNFRYLKPIKFDKQLHVLLIGVGRGPILQVPVETSDLQGLDPVSGKNLLSQQKDRDLSSLSSGPATGVSTCSDPNGVMAAERGRERLGLSSGQATLSLAWPLLSLTAPPGEVESELPNPLCHSWGACGVGAAP